MSEEEPSKSARKRDAQRLKDLGRQLADLNDEQRAALALPEILAKAVADFRRITSHEAKRRQGQLIGRLMRAVDVGEIEHALDGLNGKNAQARFAHHETERWRDALIADDAAMTDYISTYPTTDRAQLRSLIRAARRQSGDPTAFRMLFRHLRENAALHAAALDAVALDAVALDAAALDAVALHAPDPDDASVPPTVT
jgi:ribosome-associated protein